MKKAFIIIGTALVFTSCEVAPCVEYSERWERLQESNINTLMDLVGVLDDVVTDFAAESSTDIFKMDCEAYCAKYNLDVIGLDSTLKEWERYTALEEKAEDFIKGAGELLLK